MNVAFDPLTVSIINSPEPKTMFPPLVPPPDKFLTKTSLPPKFNITPDVFANETEF